MDPEPARRTSTDGRGRLPAQRSADRAPALPQQLSPQQADAAERVRRWYRDPHSKQVFRLFGYAGTGKTTAAKRIVDGLGIDPKKVIYAAYTGKAALVLVGKGCEPARTIHSLIYQPSSSKREQLEQLEESLAAATESYAIAKLRDQIAEERNRLDSPMFTLRATSDIQNASLVVVDECSMIDERMAADLCSYGIKLLVLGDPMQLPPHRGRGSFIEARPDALLTEIHRSAADSPVTAIATAVRSAVEHDELFGVHGSVGDSGRIAFDGDATGYDQILCWTNETRWWLIRRVRADLGRKGPDPERGDRIVVKANNQELEVFNGQQATVLDVAGDGGSQVLHLDLMLDDGERRDLAVYARGFAGLDGQREAEREGRNGNVAAATFAHAVTVHTAQGSQWPSVLVVDETGRMKASHRPRQWLYTAVTRASERVVIVKPPRRER